MAATLVKPINILIVDDESRACTNLKTMLISYVDPTLNIVGFAHNTTEAEEQIRKHSPDAIFLDIHMPNSNVFKMLDGMAPVPFEVIFVTAYDEYAVKAFRLNALDYILKPISLPELKNAVSKLKEKLNYKQLISSEATTFSEINERITEKRTQPFITFKGQNSVEIVNFKDIYFVEAHSSYSRILFIKDNAVKEMTMSNPLLEYEELLPCEMFFRIHKSYLVNCSHIKRIDNKESHNVVLSNDIELPVSRRRYAPLLEFLSVKKYKYE